MTKTTSAYEKTLAKVGITISGNNKLELDEDELKNADIASLKNLFTGHNSFADKIMSKGNTIASAAIIHAAAMERIAKRKVKHLEEEEAAENGEGIGSSGEDEEIYGKSLNTGTDSIFAFR